MWSPGVSYADIVKRPHIYHKQNQEGNRRGDHVELRRAGLDDYDVRLMGGRLMLIRPPGEVNLVNEEKGLGGKLTKWFDSIRAWSKSDVGIGRIVWLRFLGLLFHTWSDRVFKKLVERWGDLVAIDAATKARTQLDVVRLAILTPVLHHISLIVSLTFDEDGFPIFISKKGMAFCEKVRSCIAIGTGSSEDFSEAFFPSLASLSVVLESVEDNLATRKLTTAALHREPNTEVQKTLLVINDLEDVVWEEPVCIDGSASGKFKWRRKFRDDR
ncbi:hypothetical protein Ancab_002165 [Ancistrocladus abbreviatus]